MNYSPRNFYVWDAWCLPVDGEVHVFHLQARRPGAPVDDSAAMHLGHATSRDLVNWQERPPCFGPDESNPLDSSQPWTGCAVWHDGKGYLFYTIRGLQNEGEQHIGLATSSDLSHWTRHQNNPIITPDARWYATLGNPVAGILDCRDLIVVSDPAGGWIGFYATRIPGKELPQTSAIACVHSPDLIHWEHRAPAFVPGNIACVEVPDVFELNGRWFMTCLTGNHYGNRGYWSDPNIVNGTTYAVAERPEGPYRVMKDNVLLGARASGHISCRTLLFEGERYALYTDRERTDLTDSGGMTMGTLTTPKLVKADGDRLFLSYSSRIEMAVEEEIIGAQTPAVRCDDRIWGQIWQMPSASWEWGDSITGRCTSGWSVALLEARAESFILEATITLESGVAAGVLLRADGPMSGAVVALDADENTVGYFEAPAFDWSEKRVTPIARGVPLRLRVVARLEHIEVYLNEELRLAFSRYRGIGGQFGLFVDRGGAHFSELRLRTLKVTRPA